MFDAKRKKKKKPQKLVAIDVEELSLVDRAANRKSFSIIKAATVDPESQEIAAALKTFLGSETFPAPSLKDFKEAIVMLDLNRDRIPEDILSDVRFLAFIAAEALAEGLIKLKEAEAGDEEAIGEDANGKVKKGVTAFPTLSAMSFMKNFMFGSRLEKWRLDAAIEKAEAADEDIELKPQGPIHKALPVDDVLEEDEDELRPARSRTFTLGGLGAVGLAVGSPKPKNPVKKSLIADGQGVDDGENLWPSLSSGERS